MATISFIPIIFIIAIIIISPVILIMALISQHKKTAINKYNDNNTMRQQGGFDVKYCTTCGNKLHDNAVICTQCGCSVAPIFAPAQKADANSTGLNILSFLWPLLGLILYLVLKDEKPIKASGCGKFALIGFIMSIVSCSLLVFCSTLGFVI